jgi:hypothetical protein
VSVRKYSRTSAGSISTLVILHQLGREAHRDLSSANCDGAILEGLAQRLQDVLAELGQLVEEEHPAVGQADLARPRPAAPAHQSRVRDRVDTMRPFTSTSPHRLGRPVLTVADFARALRGLNANCDWCVALADFRCNDEPGEGEGRYRRFSAIRMIVRTFPAISIARAANVGSAVAPGYRVTTARGER